MEPNTLRVASYCTAAFGLGAGTGLYLQRKPAALLVIAAVALAALALYCASLILGRRQPIRAALPAAALPAAPQPPPPVQPPTPTSAPVIAPALAPPPPAPKPTAAPAPVLPPAPPPLRRAPILFIALPLHRHLQLQYGDQHRLQGAQIWETTIDGVPVSIQPVVEKSSLGNQLHDSIRGLGASIFSESGYAARECLTNPIPANTLPGLEREPATNIVLPIKVRVYTGLSSIARGSPLGAYLDTGVIAIREIRNWLTEQPHPRPTKISVFWLSAWEDNGRGESNYPEEHWPGAKPGDWKELETFNKRLATL